MTTKKAQGAVVHRRVEHVMSKIGSDISIARRVRKISTADFAERIGVSRATLHRLESGDASVSMNAFIMAMHALGRLDAIADVTDARHDHVTMQQMMADVPARIRRPKKTATSASDVDEVSNGKFVGF